MSLKKTLCLASTFVIVLFTSGISHAAWVSVGSFEVNHLSIGSGGTLDVGIFGVVKDDVTLGNKFYAPPLPGVIMALAKGYAGGAWDQFDTAITNNLCRNAPQMYGMAALSGQEYRELGPNYSQFHDIPVWDDYALIQLTYAGDVNLDGNVTEIDLNIASVSKASGSGMMSWSQGDVSYDGVVDDWDLYIIGSQLEEQAFGVPYPTLYIGAAPVPEPSTLILLGMSALALLFIRIRR